MNTAAPPEANPSAPAFQQRLGLFDATMLVAGSMIGSGIFILPSVMTRDVGSAGWLLLAWALTGLVTVSGALSYAELAAMMPHAGGQYVYLREAFGRFWAFLYGWTLFLVIQTGLIAAVAVAFAKFLGVFLPKLGIQEQAGAHILYRVPDLNLLWQLRLPWMKESLTIFEMKEFQIAGGHLVAVAVIAVLTLLNCRGLREGKWVQNLFTVAKIIALALLILVGLTVAWNPAAIKANTADWWSAIFDTVTFREVLKIVPQGGALAIAMVVGATMVYSLFASDAWNNVTFTAGETRNPRRNLPLSLLLGTGMVTLLYLLANCAYLASLPMRGDPKLDLQARTLEREAERLEASDQAAAAKAVREKEKRIIESASTEERGIAYAKDGRVATAVLERVSPGLGVMLMGLALMISTFGCDNGLILMGARSYFAMARDGLFFQAVGRLSRRGVPAAGLILQGIWSALLIFTGSYEALTEYAVFAALIFYVLTVIGLFVLRRKQPAAERPYRAFGYPIIPALYIVLCTAIMLDLLLVKPAYSWAGLIVVLTGIPVYFLWKMRRASTTS